MSNIAEGPFSIEAITSEDRQAVIDFLREFFYRDEPLIIALDMTVDVKAMAKLEAYCNSLLDNGNRHFSNSHLILYTIFMHV